MRRKRRDRKEAEIKRMIIDVLYTACNLKPGIDITKIMKDHENLLERFRGEIIDLQSWANNLEPALKVIWDHPTFAQYKTKPYAEAHIQKT